MYAELKNISKAFGEKQIFHDYSVQFPPSGFVALMGESGCGKTTLLRMLAGLDRPDSGVLCIDSHKISFVFQEPRLFPWLTALENIMAVSSIISSQDAIALLDQLGLVQEDIHKYPSQLSGGMQRRVSIARALAYGGDLYLMDEPFTGLDETTKQSVCTVLRSHCAGSLCIFVTHDIRDAETLSAEIRILHKNTPSGKD